MGRNRIISLLFLFIFGIVLITACGTSSYDHKTGLETEEKGGEENLKEPLEKKLNVKKPDLKKEFKSKKLKSVFGEDEQLELFSTDLQLTKSDGILQLNFRLDNTSGEPLTFTFGSSQQYDFTIYNEQNKKVYQWSEGKAFLTVIQEVTLDPGDSLTYNPTWDFTDKTGTRLPDGKYRVEFVVTAKISDKSGNIIHSPKKAIAEIDTRAGK